jgi:uncharacterized protein YceK
MIARAGTLIVVAVLVCLVPGCGTFVNLQNPPSPTPLGSLIGKSSCEPFAGAEYSFVGGQFLLGSPFFPLGVWAIVVDTPLSYVGDALTLPIVNDRKRGDPWATWWGEQAKNEPINRVDELQMPPDEPPTNEKKRPYEQAARGFGVGLPYQP